MFKVSRIIMIILLVTVICGHVCVAQQTANNFTLKPNNEIQALLKSLVSFGETNDSGKEELFREKLALLEKMVDGQH